MGKLWDVRVAGGVEVLYQEPIDCTCVFLSQRTLLGAEEALGDAIDAEAHLRTLATHSRSLIFWHNRQGIKDSSFVSVHRTCPRPPQGHSLIKGICVSRAPVSTQDPLDIVRHAARDPHHGMTT